MDLSATIHLFGDILGQVLAEQESPAILELEEQIRSLAKAARNGEDGSEPRLAMLIQSLDIEQARAIAAAFSLYFDLVNPAKVIASSFRSMRRSSVSVASQQMTRP